VVFITPDVGEITLEGKIDQKDLDGILEAYLESQGDGIEGKKLREKVQRAKKELDG
jgi:hypothetical protein